MLIAQSIAVQVAAYGAIVPTLEKLQGAQGANNHEGLLLQSEKLEAYANLVLTAGDTMLADLAMRSQMSASADLASRLVNKAAGRVELRPNPHRFAAFHVLRRTEAPVVLFEAGYLSNADDELLLRDPAERAKMVLALAHAIEADVASHARH